MTKYYKNIEDITKYSTKVKNNFCVAIIPARGGSKSIKDKNIKLLDNKPLISYSIKIAQSSDKIYKTIVTSDSQKIIRISKNYGANTILRPNELANDIIHPEPSIIHALLKFLDIEGFLPECTLMLQPTSPIRELVDIEAAIDDILSGKFNSSISGTKSHHFIWEKDSSSEWIPPYGKRRPRRQDFNQITETGSFFAFNTLKFLQEGDRIIKPTNIIETGEICSYEIDSPFEWEILESLIRFNK